MKSTTRVIALLVGLLLGMFLLTGSDCNKSSEPGTASLIGTWKLTQMTVKGTPLGDMTMTEATPGFPNMSITVNENGTFTATTVDEGTTETETGTWSTNGDQFTITVDGTSETHTYSLNGNTLTLTMTLDMDLDGDYVAETYNVEMQFTKQ